jgi:hypothetical protein
VDVCDIPLDIKPRKVDIFNGVLHIVWPAQKISEYPVEDLVKLAYAQNREAVPPPSNNVSLIEIKYGDLTKSEYSRALLDRINRFGCVVVRGRGTGKAKQGMLVVFFFKKKEFVFHLPNRYGGSDS